MSDTVANTHTLRNTLWLTPSQTAGPYLSIGLLRELITNELVDSGDPRAVRIRGTLLDGAGEGVPDGLVESWQADDSGRYGSDGFLGFGRSGTAEGGRFEIVTVKPGRVPWPAGGEQAPQVRFVVFARGLLKHVVTRMYFPDEEEANATDPVLSGLDEAARSTLVATAEGDDLRFDIRLQGPRQTTFFAV